MKGQGLSRQKRAPGPDGNCIEALAANVPTQAVVICAQLQRLVPLSLIFINLYKRGLQGENPNEAVVFIPQMGDAPEGADTVVTSMYGS